MSTSALRPINADWFKRQFELKRLSQRGLARHLNLDPSAVTHILQGKRRMQLEEAVEIGRFLGQSVEEVLKNAGLPLKSEPTRTVPIVGHIDESHEVHIGETVKLIEVPARVPEGTVAVRIQGMLADGGLAFFKPANVVEPEAIGRLSIARMKNGPILASQVNKGTEPGLYELKTGQGFIHDATLESATPVLWIRP